VIQSRDRESKLRDEVCRFLPLETNGLDRVSQALRRYNYQCPVTGAVDIYRPSDAYDNGRGYASLDVCYILKRDIFDYQYTSRSEDKWFSVSHSLVDDA
jgi:hypothetical protein